MFNAARMHPSLSGSSTPQRTQEFNELPLSIPKQKMLSHGDSQFCRAVSNFCTSLPFWFCLESKESFEYFEPQGPLWHS